jgi:hypothetical protein
MATYYWVGGSGTWDATSTTNWASSSGGAGGAGVPTSLDDVIFDAASNIATGAFTVTIGGTVSAPAVCNDFSTGGAGGALDGAMTLTFSATGFLDCYGSMTLPATNFAFSASAGARISFKATTTGKTLTTNGVAATNIQVYFDGVSGEWTFGSAITANSGIFLVNGSLVTNNQTVTATFSSINSNARSLSLGSSTWSSSSSGFPWDITDSTNMTLNAGTSTLSFTAAAQTNFVGGGLTYYNVQFTGTGANSSYSNGTTVAGVNTFNNLSFASRAATGFKQVAFFDNQTISGTLTFGTGNTAIRRMFVQSSGAIGGSVITSVGKQITLTVATLAAVNDVDFRDTVIAGVAAPLTGTRLGDRGNCSGITFTAAANKYWNLAAGGNWSATAWALGSGGAVDVNNFPLAQDTVIIEDAGLNTSATITIDSSWQFGNIDASSRTNAMTLALGSIRTSAFGNITLSSAVTTTAATNSQFIIQKNGELEFTSNGATFQWRIVIDGLPSTFKLMDNTSATNAGFFQITTGSLDLNGNALTVFGIFRSTIFGLCTIDFDNGKIVCNGNSGGVWEFQNLTDATFLNTNTGYVEYDNSVGVGTRSILHGNLGGITEARAVSFKVINGTDSIDTSTNSAIKDLDLTGFGGTFVNRVRSIYGNLTISTGMTVTAGANATTFAATSGTQQITNNGKTLDFPLVFDGIGGTFAFQDALTQGSTRAFTVTNGTVQLKDGVTSTVGSFATSGANQKFLQSTTPGSQATLSQASGTVSVSNLTIRDINATGGAVWFAPVSQLNIDDGNNDGCDFFVQLGQYMYTRRKNKRLLIS